MRSAIVDDIASEREILKARINKQLARLSLDAGVFPFASGADFLSAAGKERFDLIFPDIYTSSENGVKMGVRAFRYLVKPCTDADLAKTARQSFGNLLFGRRS